MTDEQKKPHISPSQVASYTRCGEAYRRRYLEGEIIPPTIALTKGTSIHRGANHNYKQKIESHRDLPVKEVVDFSVSEFEQEIIKKDVTLSPEDESQGKALALSSAKDRTAEMARVMGEQLLPKYQPVGAEEEISIELPGSHNLKGYIDLRTEGNDIVDLKTSSKATWNQDKVDKDFQLTFYAMAAKAITNKNPRTVIVENLIDTGKVVRVSPFVSRRGGDDYNAAIARLNRVLHGINAGVFPPASDGAWWCAPAYCGYYRTCPFVKK